jgi:predicted transcriptional regulator
MVRTKPIPRTPRKLVDARATVGFDPATYDRLQAIANDKCAPIAQIVREAVAEYLADRPVATNNSSN